MHAKIKMAAYLGIFLIIWANGVLSFIPKGDYRAPIVVDSLRMNFESEISSSVLGLGDQAISAIASIPSTALSIPGRISDALTTVQESGVAAGSRVADAAAGVSQLFTGSPLEIARHLSTIDVPIATELVSLSVVGATTVLAVFASVPDPAIDEVPYAGTATGYNVAKANSFFNKRPLFVAKRMLELARLTNTFTLALLLDWRFGKWEENQPMRAAEALVLANKLGPTFIKLGQALSIRTDLIPEAYALELRQLQDAVPPFDDVQAKEVIRKELGVSNLSQVFKTISARPIASASIGQVYKGTLHDGREVAVKVQRPGILGEIALDLYVLRALTPAQVYLSNAINGLATSQADIDVALQLVDEWGRGFVAEVDYRTESANSKQFAAAMVKRGLTAVTCPECVDEFCTTKVIMTEWVEGSRLDQDESPDVPRLCGVAINAYLTMLLDTGVLHCDPHPGNLKRTPDGRLCILDWGMTLDVPRDLQYGLLEFIAHVNSEDYDAMPGDFVSLGFTPPEQLERVKNSGLTEGLAFALRQLNKGGGPTQIQARVKEEFLERYGRDLTDEELRDKARAEMVSRMEDQLKSEGVDVNGVTNVMEEMSRRNRELFKLPSYVLYVSRAFSTLEGIGLSVNPDYSILNECYPYLAKRLLSDDSPRAKSALRSMLGAGSDGAVFSPEKFLEMTESFGTFTESTTMAEAAVGTGSGGVGRLVVPSQAALQREQVRALVDVLLSEEGSGIQDLLLEEAARLVDASVRDSVMRIEGSLAGVVLKQLLKTPLHLEKSAPGVARPFFAAATAPYHIGKGMKMLLSKMPEDETAVAALRQLWSFGQRSMGTRMYGGKDGACAPSLDTMRGFVQELVVDPQSPLRLALSDPDVLRRFPQLAALARKFSATLAGRAVERFEMVQSPDGTVLSGRVVEGARQMSRRVASVLVSPKEKKI